MGMPSHRSGSIRFMLHRELMAAQMKERRAMMSEKSAMRNKEAEMNAGKEEKKNKNKKHEIEE